MEEKIYQKLKEGLKNSPHSDRTIRSKAKRLAERYKDEDSFTDDILNDVIEDFKELGGQYNKDVAETIQAEKEKLKAEYLKIKKEKTDDEDNPPKQIEELKQEVERVKSLFEQREKSERIDKTKKAALKILKESHKADNDYVLSNTLLKVEISDNDTAESIAQKAIPIYDSEYKMAYGEGVQPRVKQDGGETKNDFLNELVAKKKKQLKTN